ncbi:hypothetical protein ECEC96038_0808, partial [Escherichia coli EC96038]
SPFLKDAV